MSATLGMRVFHGKSGYGEIVAIEGRRSPGDRVRTRGTKEVLDSVVSLE